MERVNAICRHKLWRESVDEIARLEQDRAFCRHDRAHFLDVARLAYIENLERGLGVDKELIYAAALLHDVVEQVCNERLAYYDSRIEK